MTIKNTSIFQVTKNKHARPRRQTTPVILTHMIDLLDSTKKTTADLVYDISDKNQYNDHFFYFRRDVGYEHRPYHFFFETYYNEIFNYAGCSLSNRSEYLEELCNKNILNNIYKDATLFVVNGNFGYDLCEKAMYTQLAYYIAGFMNYEMLKLESLFFLEDIINKDEAKKSNFMFTPMTHFNKGRFKQEILRYKDK